MPDWQTVTRLGQAEIVLPAALLTVAVLLVKLPTRGLALRWMLGLALAVLVTLASKIAFIGWGIGWQAIDFTGISGHAMCAAAIYPMLFLALASGWSPRWIVVMQTLAWSVVIAVAVSRLMVGAHSPSEVVAGFLLGGAVSVAALAKADRWTFAVHPVALFVLLVWFSTGGGEMPPSQTHSRITRLALSLSGRKAPIVRTPVHLPHVEIPYLSR